MKEKNWFEEWFDSPYYHILYENRNKQEAERFIANMVRDLHIGPNAKILDVACGKGRHSRTLATFGFDVTGIDLSKNNIEAAKQFEAPKLHFEVADMRCVYKREEFDYVFNLFSSFGYFEDDNDDYAAVKAFAGNLKPGGTLILDYMNTECTVKLLKSRDIVEREGIQFHVQKRVENGFIKKKIDFLVNGENHHYEEKLKVINHHKFKEMLHHAGLEERETFGDYDLNPFNPSSSMRLILVAQKNPA